VAIARKILSGLAWLYLAGIALQFFFAGLGLLGGETMKAHNDFGWAVLHLYPILMLIAALAGRVWQTRTLMIMIVALVLLVFIQPILAAEGRGEITGALHLPNALLIAYLTLEVAKRSTALARTGAAVAA
jgi:hypothetical protein